MEEAVDVIRRTRPNVVLLDVRLPGGGGRAVIEGVRDDKLDTLFLALSVSDAADDVIGVVRAGARALRHEDDRRRGLARLDSAGTRRRCRVLAPPRRRRAGPTRRCQPTPSSIV